MQSQIIQTSPVITDLFLTNVSDVHDVSNAHDIPVVLIVI